jgi:hypothetical protein
MAMTAVLLVFILALLLGGAGFALNVLWYVAAVVLLLWVIGFFVRGPESRWFYW